MVHDRYFNMMMMPGVLFSMSLLQVHVHDNQCH